MRCSNVKHSKVLINGVVLYCIMILDILINTIIAHTTNDGASRITNAVMIGPIVFNPISVICVFVLGTIFISIGLILKKQKG